MVKLWLASIVCDVRPRNATFSRSNEIQNHFSISSSGDSSSDGVENLMRRMDLWRPSKFAMIDGRLQGDPTGAHLAASSRLIGDLTAQHYEAALKACARGRLLDLGCGNVPLFGLYREMVDEVICIDWPASRHQKQHIDVFADLTLPLPLNDSSFDTILLSDVLEHIPNPENLVREIARLLRPGGATVIGVPFLYWIHETPHDYNRYTRYQLERLLTKAGLEITELVEVGGSPEVLADIMGKTLASRPRVAASFGAVARWLLRRGFVRRISDRTRSLFPAAYVVVARKEKVPLAVAKKVTAASA
jgi:SAM-dependent methyltransferase